MRHARRSLTFAAHAGSSPSRAIAKKMRGCPYWNTSSTAVSDTTAPNDDDPSRGLQASDVERLAPADRPRAARVYGTSPVATTPTIT